MSMNTVSVDRKFLEHCLSVMRGVGELCQPIPRKSEDDPTEYCGGQALAELANCHNRLQETIAYAEQVALPPAEQDHAGPLDGEGRRSTQGGRSMNTVSISRKTLEDWALCLSQGDISPRWEIEDLLAQPEQPAKITCHAEGERCYGCAHYRGEAGVCEFAEQPEAGRGVCSRCHGVDGDCDALMSDDPTACPYRCHEPQAQEAALPANAEAVRVVSALRSLWKMKDGALALCNASVSTIEAACREADTFLAQHGGRGDE